MNYLHCGSVAVLNTMAINNLGRKLDLLITAHFPICLHTKLTSTELFQFTTQVTSRQELINKAMDDCCLLFVLMACSAYFPIAARATTLRGSTAHT